MTEDAYTRAAKEAGGTQLSFTFAKNLDRYAPGCGALTHVAGTNGGTMPCGAMLRSLDGTEAPYFCGSCYQAIGKVLLIQQINAIYAQHRADFGARIDLAIDAIRTFGVRDPEETRRILRQTDYAQEAAGSVTSLIIGR